MSVMSDLQQRGRDGRRRRCVCCHPMLGGAVYTFEVFSVSPDITAKRAL